MNFKIHEATDTLGGNAITIKFKDFLFDSGAHRWHDKYPDITGELISIMGQEFKRIHVPSRMYDPRIKTNKIAHDTAMNILYRAPFGVMKLAWQSYMDYWDPGLLKETLQGDRCTRALPDTLIKILRSYYHLYGEGLPYQKTLTNQYFLNAIPWFMVLFSLPLIIAISIFMDKGRHVIFLALLGFFSLLILMNSTALVHRNTMRFFHPDEWTAIIFLGVIFDRIMKKNFVKNLRVKLRLINKKIGRDMSDTSSDYIKEKSIKDYFFSIVKALETSPVAPPGAPPAGAPP